MLLCSHNGEYMNPWDPNDSASPETIRALKAQSDSVSYILATIERIHNGTTETAKDVTPVGAPISTPEDAPKFRTFERLHSLFLGLTSMILKHGEFALTSTTLAPAETTNRSDYDLAA